MTYQPSPTLLRQIFTTLIPLSLTSNLLLLLCVAFLPRFHKPISYLQTNLALCEILQCLIYLIGPDTTHPLVCTVIGGLKQFVFNAITFWSFCISFYCYLTVMYHPGVANRWWWFYHVYAWGLSGFMVGIMFWVGGGAGVVGDAVFECWISKERRDLRVWLFYVELWAYFVGFVVMFWGMFLKVRRVRKEMGGIVTGVVPKVEEGEQVEADVRTDGGNLGDTEDGGRRRVAKVGGIESQTATRTSSRIESFTHSRAGSMSRNSRMSRTGSCTEFQSQDGKPDFVDPSDIIPAVPALPLPRTKSRRFSTFSVLFPTSIKSRPERRGTIVAIQKKGLIHFKLILRASMITVGFLITWIPPSVARVWDMVHPDGVPGWLTLWVAVCFASSGLWNSGVFYLTWFWSDLERGCQRISRLCSSIRGPAKEELQ
ncbi:hypothetical protein HDU79_006750 [Rhizoclosmatium sp. JEL0117]|nr:hypothetical protein HDU79_006750 [Rhizoclosmatium sp. JEL0117]